MPLPPGGSTTLYYSNQQSARLLFYHDHAWGITRLNVYGGMAAPYLLVDQAEDDMIASGALPSQGGIYKYGIPLVIQDKTFVNDATTQATATANAFAGTPTYLTSQVDPLWNTYVGIGGVPGTATGGSLWFPHEYMPNETIYGSGGVINWGRWDYAPWLNPPLTPIYPNLPSPTHVPESFMDTMVVNGTAFPFVNVPPQAVRFRILNACNDRSLNLSLFVAADKNSPTTAGTTGAVMCSGTGAGFPLPENCTEIKMVPATNYPALPFCSPTATPDPKTGLPAGCTPLTWPTDGRDDGVPDPTFAGPKIYQIGNEGGILPQVAEIPAQPVNYEYNRRVPTMLNVTDQALLLMPAVRADIIVDFSQYAGQTLILYNDNAAPMPLFDDRNDLRTGMADMRAIGGSPSVQPGFGPNTRTVLQIRVDNTAPAPAFNPAALKAALPQAYAATQAPPIVPQTAYSQAFSTITNDTYVTNTDATVNLSGAPQSVAKVMVTLPGSGYTAAPTVSFISADGTGSGASATACLNGVTAVTVTAAGTGYTSIPTVALTGGGGTGATAVASISGGGVSAITVTNPGCNYTTNPTVTITGGGGTGAAGTSGVTLGGVGSITLNPGGAGSGYMKAPFVFLSGGNGTGATADAMLVGDTVVGMKNITEGFEPWYGRMNVQLGTTPVPLDPTAPAPQVPGIAMYIDPPSDFWDDGKTYVFRVAHLGVDSHVVHFHLANLQVVNRVDFTNTLMPPDPNELGWKETIRTNPFTDLILAAKPKSHWLPFQIPQSNRLLDPTTTAGSIANFVQPAVVPGLPTPAGISNVMTNYGWEYVWHCHLLGHEENDMMRPIVFSVPVPPVPTALAATLAAPNVNLTWNGGANTNAGTYTIQRATNSTFTAGLTTFGVNGVPPTAAYTDVNVPGGTSWYRVRAENGAGVSAWSTSATVTVVAPPPAPTGLTASIVSATQINLSWVDASNNETSFTIWRSDNGAPFTQIGAVNRTGTQITSTGGAVVFSNTNAVAALVAGHAYSYYVKAANAAGPSPASNQVNVNFAAPANVTTVSVTAARTGSVLYDTATVTWTNPAGNTQTGFRIQRAMNAAFTSGLTTVTVGANITSYTTGTLYRNRTYYFRVQAYNGVGPAAYVNAAPFPITTP